MDGSFWRFEARMVTVNVPLIVPATSAVWTSARTSITAGMRNRMADAEGEYSISLTHMHTVPPLEPTIMLRTMNGSSGRSFSRFCVLRVQSAPMPSAIYKDVARHDRFRINSLLQNEGQNRNIAVYCDYRHVW